MIIERPEIRIVSKIIRLENGIYVMAYFAVTQKNGRYFVRLIETRKIDPNLFGGEKHCLPKNIECKVCADKIKDIGKIIVSPYFNLDFFISQMTRAPSGK